MILEGPPTVDWDHKARLCSRDFRRYLSNVGRRMRVTAVELYDHQVDPSENVNIAQEPTNAKLVAELTQKWKTNCPENSVASVPKAF